MLVHWLTDEGEVHYAGWVLGGQGVLHLEVVGLGESGWD